MKKSFLVVVAFGAIARALAFFPGCLDRQWESSVTFYGGAGQVGGSCAIVQRGETRILVDCGTFYDDEHSSRRSTGKGAFDFDLAQIDAMVLSHAHQDHLGRIPALVRAGFRGRIMMTRPTLALFKIVLRSQLAYETDVQRHWVWTSRNRSGMKFHWRRDCKWSGKIANKNRRTFVGTYSDLKGKLGIERSGGMRFSLCDVCRSLEVEELSARAQIVNFGESVEVSPFKIVFRPVKHLPGAAAIYFDDGRSKFVFSGDLGTCRSRFTDHIDPAEPVDDVFLEATYGDVGYAGKSPDEKAQKIEKEYERFRELVGDVVRNGGIAWIPAFALDRSQRVLVEVARGMSEGKIPVGVPIFYPSPTSRAITSEYLRHPEWFDNALPSTMASLFAYSQKRFDVKNHRGAAILLTTSGMMDTGFSNALIPDLVPRSDVVICLVGYQSPQTCGGRLEAKKEKTLYVERNGERVKVPVVCRVEKFNCFSGHGDAEENDAWLAKNKTARIHLVHGDPKSLEARRDGLRRRFDVIVDIVQPGIPYVVGEK